MAFVNFQRYVCDNCGKQVNQREHVHWFELVRHEGEQDATGQTYCYMGYKRDACSVECLTRLTAEPMNLFKKAHDYANN